MSSRLETLRQRYDEYIKAEDAILNGSQEYRIGSRTVKRSDLKAVSDMIAYLEKEIAVEESKQSGKGRNRVVGVIPRDF